MNKQLIKNNFEPLYISLYEHYRGLIKSGTLSLGSKMPSIRRCAQELELSRTTVEAAYMMLTQDGYIVSKPQSGYFVCEAGMPEVPPVKSNENCRKATEQVQYDFVTSSADSESFNLAIWSRYVKSALRQGERLLTYGEPQGEEDLRKAICLFASKQRGVVCSPQQVIIGAGTQSLLQLLCAMTGKPRTAVFTGPFFSRGGAVMRDHGFKTVNIPVLPESLDELTEIQPDMIYVSPSHMTESGDVLSVGRRRELLSFASKNNCLILEDDYDSEFRYYSRPVASLQGMDASGSVVYFGSFSKLLLPSIRVSFMVLPESLMAAYRSIEHDYNQTASKTEQIALCRYISDGRLGAQIRKLRKLYVSKADLLCREAQTVFGKKACAVAGGAGYLVRLEVDDERSSAELAALALKNGVAVKALAASAKPQLLLCCSGFAPADYKPALERLYSAFFS